MQKVSVLEILNVELSYFLKELLLIAPDPISVMCCQMGDGFNQLGCCVCVCIVVSVCARVTRTVV